MSDNTPQKYYGKYRGKVVNNNDPLQIGRLQIEVLDVAGLFPTTWAMPCFPFTGIQMGMWAIPQVQAGVWVEFEQGDPDYPIWSGCWYGSAAEVPALALPLPPSPPLSNIVLQTTGQNTLMLSDATGPSGGILIKNLTGAFISITDTGITISNGQGATIVMTGLTVMINGDALTIT